MKNRSHHLTLLSFAGTAAMFVVACDAQQTPDYTGNPPMSSLVGLVTNGRTQPTPPSKVVIEWGDVGLMFPPYGAGVNLTGNFPEAFQIDLFNAPPAERLFLPSDAFPTGYYDPAGESRIAIAHILAVKQDVQDGSFINDSDVIGGAEDYELAYVEHDIAAGTAGAAYLGGPVAAGYHVLAVATDADMQTAYPPIAQCEAAAADVTAWKACGIFTYLSVAPTDATVGVRLVDDYSQLQFRLGGPLFVTPGTNLNPPPPQPCPNPPPGQMWCAP